MNIEDIRKETRYWQRMLRLAGYYTGKIDGIRGKLQIAAEKKWDEEQATVRESYGTLDERSERNLETLLPRAQNFMRHWLSQAIPKAAEMGYTLKVICGTRSYAEQDALYDKGRTKPGAKVTNARGGYSNHNFGIAIDIGLFDAKTGAYITDGKPYDELAAICPPHSTIEWGGSWKSLHDAPHYQSTLFGDSTAAIRKRFEA